MTLDRKDFLKKICLSGACMCGFSAIALPAKASTVESVNNKSDVKEETPSIVQDWLSDLLSNLDKNMNPDVLKNTIKKSAAVHYKHLKMDDMLSDYKGNLEAFINMLNEKWGWKIDYDQSSKTLIADENKNFCVCPIIKHDKDIDTSVLCYCSEGFAEKMFSAVSGVPVTGTVIASVRKGDPTCKYKVVFSD